jgi:hypothetical protein
MDSYLQRVAPIEYVRQNYSDTKILFPGHGQASSPKTLLDEQLDYISTFRSLVEQQQMQSATQVGGERATNIPEEGKIIIKSELQRLYPNYIPVVNGIPLPTLLDLNIDAVAKEISQEK